MSRTDHSDERQPGDRVPAEIPAQSGNVEPGVAVVRLVHRGEMCDTELGELSRELGAGLRIHNPARVDKCLG